MSERSNWDFFWVALFTGFGGACSVDVQGVRHVEETSPSAAGLEVRGVRRLSEPEYRTTLATLLGDATRIETPLPPSARQRGFSRNAEQVADSFSVAALHALATEAANAAVRSGALAELSELPECSDGVDRECSLRLVAAFGGRAFRRPLTDEEYARYLALFDAGREGADELAGVELVVATMLESPFTVYAQAIGDGPTTLRSPRRGADASAVRLTSHEVASELAYAITAGPPDSELTRLAAGNALFDAGVREREARRLFGKSATRFQYRRFVDEWLELDRLFETAKDLRAYPDFPSSRPLLQGEAWDFVDRAMVEESGTLARLLTGAANVEVGGEIGTGERAGLLELPAFLAVHAHPTTSAPVLRGAAVLRRVLCRDFPTPDELGILVTPPPPDPNATTRERFEAHAGDPACSGCHAEIDPVGGTFEAFDAVGARRSEDAGRVVDTSGSISVDGRAQALSNSHELARVLAASEDAERCFARQVFRYLGARNDEAAEEAFVADARMLPQAKRASLVELAVEYVASERFVWRRSEP